MINYKIFLCSNSIHNFDITQKFIIDSLTKIPEDKRTAILIDYSNTTLLMNIKATLWYYEGYSYPHLSSEDELASESNIVLTNKTDYIINNKFNYIIVIYSNLTSISTILTLLKQCTIYIIETEETITKLMNELIKNNIPFSYQACDTDDIINTDSQEIKQNIIEPQVQLNSSQVVDDEAEYHKKLHESNLQPDDDNTIDYTLHQYDFQKPSDNISKNKSMKHNADNYKDNINNRSTSKFNSDYEIPEQRPDKVIFIIKPRVIKIRQEFILLNKLADQGFLVIKYTRKKISKEIWEEFYRELQEKSFFHDYCTYLSSEYVGIATLYYKQDIYTKIRSLIGTTDPAMCKPFNLRFQFGMDLLDNGMHASDSYENFIREAEILNRHIRYLV